MSSLHPESLHYAPPFFPRTLRSVGRDCRVSTLPERIAGVIARVVAGVACGVTRCGEAYSKHTRSTTVVRICHLRHSGASRTVQKPFIQCGLLTVAVFKCQPYREPHDDASGAP